VQCTTYLSMEATYSSLFVVRVFRIVLYVIYYIMRRQPYCVSRVAHLISTGGSILSPKILSTLDVLILFQFPGIILFISRDF